MSLQRKLFARKQTVSQLYSEGSGKRRSRAKPRYRAVTDQQSLPVFDPCPSCGDDACPGCEGLSDVCPACQSRVPTDKAGVMVEHAAGPSRPGLICRGNGKRPTPSTNRWAANQHVVSGGEDTLSLSFGVVWRSEADSLFPMLQQAKDAAGGVEGAQGDGAVNIGSCTYEVAPQGHASGKGGGPRFQYVLMYGGIRISISKRKEANEKTPNVLVNIGSAALMGQGVEACYADVVAQLDGMGATILWNKVGRVDACVDLAGVAVDEFMDHFTRRCFTTRAQKSREFLDDEEGGVVVYRTGWKATGFSIGRGIMCRVYDKLEELKKSGDATKWAIMVAQRWGGEPEHARESNTSCDVMR